MASGCAVIVTNEAKKRVGRAVGAADKQLRKDLSKIASGAYDQHEEVEADWTSAFERWAVANFDAAAKEFTAEYRGPTTDLEKALLGGPGKWTRGRAFYPEIMDIVVTVLTAAGRPLPAGQPPESFVPFKAIQHAIRDRIEHWNGEATEYAIVPDSPEPADTPEELDTPTGNAPLSSWPWDTLSIRFVGPRDVIVKCPTFQGPRTFAELGFANHKNGEPVKSWAMLLAFAINQGEARSYSAAKNFSAVEKAVQDLRVRLKRAFRHADDPIATISSGRERGAYSARFTIDVLPGLDLGREIDPRKKKQRLTND